MKNSVLIGHRSQAQHGFVRGALALAILAATLALPVAGHAATKAPVKADAVVEPTQIGPEMDLVIGKSTLMRLPAPIERISVGNPAVADVTLISPHELYLLGKMVGATNVILWRKGGTATIIDVAVNVDAARLQHRIDELLPDEKEIKVSTAAESIILSGVVSSSEKADQAVNIAESYARNLNRGLVLPVTAGGGQAAPGTTISVGTPNTAGGAVAAAGSRVVNMLRVSAPQQVMLEVKVAEVSKTLLDKLGATYSWANGNWIFAVTSSLLSAMKIAPNTDPLQRSVQIDAQKKDGLVKILAEPNIMAVSGQEGSFLAGGKIFIPVARNNGVGGTTITLEEKEFGVGLKFTPTVLGGGRINLKVAPEVSELSQTGSPFTTIDGSTAILPSFTTRRAQTTVQLNDGQSFAIAGLIKSNVTESMKRLPVLGEIPVLGALFRSNEFQDDQTELMFVVTPRLVKPLPPDYALPTDHFAPPSRGEFFIEGRMEGSTPRAAENTPPAAAVPEAPARGGFEVK